jgi:hypothetical protein
VNIAELRFRPIAVGTYVGPPLASRGKMLRGAVEPGVTPGADG